MMVDTKKECLPSFLVPSGVEITPPFYGGKEERSRNKTRELKASTEIEKGKISEYNGFRFGDQKIQNTRRFLT